jgi:molybdopterin molybdotransferase
MIAYDRALQLTLDHIPVLGTEDVSLLDAVDPITAADLNGRVDSPLADVSLKDGDAIQSADIASAREDAAVSLRIVGKVAAGGEWPGQLGQGEAVRILSGAPVWQSWRLVMRWLRRESHCCRAGCTPAIWLH